MKQIIWVGLGGLCGAVARYSLAKWLIALLTMQPHLVTMDINIIGSFLLGLVSGWLTRQGELEQSSYLFLTVGFCGAFTTFSSWISDITLLARQQTLRQAIMLALLSLTCGLAAFGGGFLLGGGSTGS